MPLRRYIAPQRVRGAFRHHLVSGVLGGLAAGAVVASFQNASLTPLAVRRISLGFAALASPFQPGQYKFELFAARTFTVADSGGTAATLTLNNGKLATSFTTTDLSDFRISAGLALSAGTRTLDDTAMAALAGVVSDAINTSILVSGTPLFYAPEMDDWPLVIEQNEGFVIKATTPVNGTWCFDCGVDYQSYATGSI